MLIVEELCDSCTWFWLAPLSVTWPRSAGVFDLNPSGERGELVDNEESSVWKEHLLMNECWVWSWEVNLQFPLFQNHRANTVNYSIQVLFQRSTTQRHTVPPWIGGGKDQLGVALERRNNTKGRHRKKKLLPGDKYSTYMYTFKMF